MQGVMVSWILFWVLETFGRECAGSGDPRTAMEDQGTALGTSAQRWETSAQCRGSHLSIVICQSSLVIDHDVQRISKISSFRFPPFASVLSSRYSGVVEILS